jgi:hypothetical protein
MSIFNRGAWQEFTAALDHKHIYESSNGYLNIDGRVTLLKCKCGRSEWFFSK